MKLTTLLLTAAILNVSAKCVSQKVTLSARNASLSEVFDSVKKQTGYTFVYLDNLLSAGKPVNITAKDLPLSTFLDRALKDQPYTYLIQKQTILVSAKTLQPIVELDKDTPPLTGIVTGRDGQPLAGVNVVVKGSKRGTTTDVNGWFIIDANAGETLVFSSVGYGTKEIKSEAVDKIIALEQSVSPLDEVQIIAYGATSRRLNTSSVSTVTSKEIEMQPVSNPLAALIGRVPGMFITQNTGVPGGAFNVQIRGRNSIANGADPLYVIDGVPYASQVLPNQGNSILQNGYLSPGAGSPLSFISASDIESISILKDADATAIYGSRGANGVVLITTKKGKSGKSQLSLNVSAGVSEVHKKIDLMNTAQYLEMRREAFKNDGAIPDASSAPDIFIWDTTRSTDWQKVLIGGTGHYTDLQASLSGGNTNTQYLIGGTFHKETSVFPGEFADHKGSVNFNINNNSLNKKFKITLSGRYLIDDNQLPTADFTSALPFLASHAPDPYNPDGSLHWVNYSLAGVVNPFALTRQKYNIRTSNLISNLNLSYQLLNGLAITSNFGYTSMLIDEISTMPIASLNPFLTKTGTASFTDNSLHSWIIEPQITYLLSVGKSRIEALTGTTFQQNNTNGHIVTGSGYTSDALLENILAAPVFAVNSVTKAAYKYNAVFARVNYNWQDKYILNLTARRDGSSRFGDNNKFHNFGSIGAAWIFSQESFIQNAMPFLSFGKMRGSYGTTGSDQIGDYRYYDLFNAAQYAYQSTVGLMPSSLYNPNLAWEETRKLEVGLDVGFFKDRVLLNANYYYNRSSNQLLSYTLSTVTGFASFPANFPAIVQNNGVEFSLNTTNIKTSTFNWNSAINMTVPRNKLVAFPNIANTSYQYTLIVGQPLTITKAFHLLGVNETTGIYEFADSKGNPTSSPIFGTDNTIAINTAPEFYGGFSNTVQYQGIQLDFLFQFTKQRGASNLFQSFSSPGMLSYNASSEVIKRWKVTGDESAVQQFTQSYSSPAFLGYTYAKQSDAAFTDASYIRLKNLSLSYQLPARWMRKMNFQNCKFYITGQNLFTVTNYKGADPENQSISILPPLRVVTGGISLTL